MSWIRLTLLAICKCKNYFFKKQILSGFIGVKKGMIVNNRNKIYRNKNESTALQRRQLFYICDDF